MAKNNARYLLLLTAAFLLSFGAATLHAEDKEAPIDWKKGGKWSALTQYIGTYDYDAVLGDTNVKTELDAMLKDRNINMGDEFAVSSPIGFENDCMILKGNRRHAGDTNNAYMEVCVGGGHINVAVRDHDKITIFTGAPDYKYMSEGLRSWVYFKNNNPGLTLKKPENVQLVVTAQ